MTDRTARRRLAAKADLVSVSVRGRTGFVKNEFADQIEAQIETHRADVERILAEPRLRGRPKLERVTDTPEGAELARLYAAFQRREMTLSEYLDQCALVRKLSKGTKAGPDR